MNLLENSIKYRSPERGLSVSIVGIPSPDGGVEISITDNGIGVPREYREKVFAMFTRLHSDDDIAGSGIGLAVCRKIVERHGGRIWIQSVDDAEPVQTVESGEREKASELSEQPSCSRSSRSADGLGSILTGGTNCPGIANLWDLLPDYNRRIRLTRPVERVCS